MTFPGNQGRTARGRSKLLVFGEHAAVWGHPAVGLSLGWGLDARWSPSPDGLWSFPDTAEPLVSPLKSLLEGLGTLAQVRGLPGLAPGQLRLKSTVPPGSGFGSSAALCAALVRLFFPQAEFSFWEEAAREAEKTFHGNPSGIDTGLALRDGWGILHPQPGACPRFEALANPSMALVCGAVPRSSNTKNLVLGIGEKMRTGDRLVRQTMDRLGETSRAAAELLLPGSPAGSSKAAGLAPLMSRAQELLTVLGLASPAQDRLFHLAKDETGALAAKLSGAGSGGAYLILYPDFPSAQNALARLGELTKTDPQPAVLVGASSPETLPQEGTP